jgi:hypothetical protein
MVLLILQSSCALETNNYQWDFLANYATPERQNSRKGQGIDNGLAYPF